MIDTFFGQGGNAFGNGEWRNGYFYPYATQSGMDSTRAQQAMRQQQATVGSSTSPSDRELLLYAAKAAGIKLAQPQDYDDRFRNVTNMAPEGNLLAAPIWNPLIDDGDALRLAVRLHIVIAPMRAVPYEERPAFTAAYTYHSPARADVAHGDDPLAATRRAIVLAAAEIGKQRS